MNGEGDGPTCPRDAASHVESEARFRAIFESSGTGIALVDLDGRPIECNPALERILGYSADELAHMRFTEFTHPDDRSLDWNLYRELVDGRRSRYEIEKRYIRKDGTPIWAHLVVSVVRDEHGAAKYAVGIVEDVTERKHAQEQLRDSEARFRALCDHALVGIYIIQDGRVAYVNPSLERLFGYERDEMVGQDPLLVMHPDDREFAADVLRRRLAREVDSIRYEVRCLRKDGTVIVVEVFGTVVQLEGRPAILGNMLDVTDRKRAEAALRESEQRFRQITDSIDEVFWLYDARQDRMLYVSPAYERIWGRSSDALLASSSNWFDAIHPDDRERIEQAVPTKQMQSGFDETYRIVRPDGSLRWIRERAFQLRTATGEDPRVVGTATDVTEQQNLEVQLRHAQKMEAIGVLAGGVAHDFNNLLAVIMSYSSMTLARLDEQDPLFVPIQEIHGASKRAATLTKQLLAFSRRQALHPRTVDLNAIVRGIDTMLRRLIGEDVELHTIAGDHPVWVRVDPGQIEQVLMNLAVNARDAMPRGGRLTIEIADIDFDEAEAAMRGLAPARYATIAVTDTGIGIDVETQQRIFEPFFTTKEAGRGTGLGLSTVFGIVQQSSGQIAVESSVGHGATFRIWLPLVAAETERPASSPPRDLRGRETVLLVEDDAHVRKLARTILAQNGYRVLEASGGGDALLVAEQFEGNIDVVLTDIVMPLLSGVQLTQRLATLRPGLRVVYMSGYPEKVHPADDGGVPEGVFVPKPFAPDELLRGVRDALSAPRTIHGA